MAQDNRIYLDMFDKYYAAAKKQHDGGDYIKAKENYLKAAKQLLILSKATEGELRKVRYDRAVKLVGIADSLEKKAEEQKNNPGGGIRIKDEEQDIKEFSEASEGQIPDVSFSDIAGLEDVKRTIKMRMINAVLYPEKYQLYKKKTGGGVLLYGPPGTGKTMIAKAVAHEVNAAFYPVKGSDIVSKWVGDSEKNITSLFESAKKQKLSIIFIDEVDGLLGARGKDIHNDRRVNEFLQHMDGVTGGNSNMLFLGATNRPWDIDSAAMRSGRFSEKIYVPLPDSAARRFIFVKNLTGVPLSSDIDIDYWVEKTDGYSGADIALFCDMVKDGPLEQYIETGEVVDISSADFEKAFHKVIPAKVTEDLAKYESIFKI